MFWGDIMIKNIKLFPNNNVKSMECVQLIKDKFTSRGFVITDDNFDLGIAIGGDCSFLRMVQDCNFNSNVSYIGVNTGTLGFLQEVGVSEIDDLITELEMGKFKIEDIGIQETDICFKWGKYSYQSLNEIVLREYDLGILRCDVNVDGNLLEHYVGDGMLIATSTGSTAHNLSYGGSIVYNTFSSLQITPIGPINSRVYSSLMNSVIIPSQMDVSIIPYMDKRGFLITIDGVPYSYTGVDRITTKIGDKKIKCLRLNKYNFPQKINEKMLNK